MPFVQGQLRKENVTVNVLTECAHCARPIHIEIDSELNYTVLEQGADPVVFIPFVNFKKLKDPSIIDAF
jgi:hypothetical protein